MNTTTSADDWAKHTAGSWWLRNGRRLSVALRVALTVAVAGAAAWWFALAPIAVSTQLVTTGPITSEILGTGTLEARMAAIAAPKLAGLIVRIAADQGDRVKSGSLLFQLEDSDIRQQVAMAESEVSTATAAVDRLLASRQKSEAVLAQAMANHKRVEQLSLQNVASQADLDRAFEALSVADAERQLASAAILEGQKRLDAAKRAVAYQQARLDDTTVEAPFDALVVRRDRDPGDVVTAGSSVLYLVSTAELWITAWVDETELTRVAEGQVARVVFRSEPTVAYPGVVARVGREADRETREIVVDVSVAKLPAQWAVGQRAEVYIEVDRREAVTTLPAGLVLVRDGKTGVMVDIDGRARWRDITVGLRGRQSVEVTSGLSPGDVVVTSAQADSGWLRDGRRISRE